MHDRQDLLAGLGLFSLIFGGIVLCSRARTHLMIEDNPADPSVCPIFGFTDVIYIPFSPPKTLPTALVSMGSPVGVPVP